MVSFGCLSLCFPTRHRTIRGRSWLGSVFIGACLVLALSPGPAAEAGEAGADEQASAWTPAPGSTERKALLDALRAEVRRWHGLEVVFFVEYLKVKDRWAWVHTRPRSKDGLNNYEDISALLRDKDSGWRILELSDGDLEGLRQRFPEAPADIFPLP